MKVYSSLDLLLNQLKGLKLEHLTLATLPTAAAANEGQLVYVTDAAAGHEIQYSDGSAWISLVSAVTASAGTMTGLTGEAGVISVSDNGDGTWAVTFDPEIDSANTANAIVARDANGDFAAGEITATNVVLGGTPSADQDAATKKYVDDVVSGVTGPTEIIGAWDPTDANAFIASTETSFPKYDLGGASMAQKGQAWYITASAVVDGVQLESGDLVTALTDNADPLSSGSWFVAQGNLTIVDASSSAKGIIEIATQAEVDAGTDTTRAVVPATLASAIGDLSSSIERHHKAVVPFTGQDVINSGAFHVLAHNWASDGGTGEPTIQILELDPTDGWIPVMVDAYVGADKDTGKVVFGTPPAPSADFIAVIH